jgi:Fe-S-cluster containining protein
MSPDDRWWSGGLRFSCVSCGECCGGAPGTVGFTPAEEGAMAHALGVDISEFRALYIWTKYGEPSLRELPNYDCVFLERQQGGLCRCGIYNARPAQCRTFPFWGEVLGSRFAWNRFASSCPGMNKGVLHDGDEIAARLLESPL